MEDNTLNMEERTFTQADVDEIVTKRLERERRKNRPGGGRAIGGADNAAEAENNAQQDGADFERENAELKNLLLLAKRGVPAGDLEYHAYRISRDYSGEPFVNAVDAYLDGNPGIISKNTVRVNFGVSPGYAASAEGQNEQMNALIRGAAKGV